MDSAAIAFSLMYTDHATEINREIGAMIYSVRTGFGRNTRTHYTFGTPWTGGRYNVIFGLYNYTAGMQWGRPSRSEIAALAHTHPERYNWFSRPDMRISHGHYRIFYIPAMPVFMSVNLNEEQRARYGHSIQVRRYDRSMNWDPWGRLILSK